MGVKTDNYNTSKSGNNCLSKKKSLFLFSKENYEVDDIPINAGGYESVNERIGEIIR